MTDKIPGLMGFVVRVLKENRQMSSAELYERAASRYPAVSEMSVRQFHARYPLQAKRQMNKPDVRRFPIPKVAPAPQPDAPTTSRDSARAQPPAQAPAAASAPAEPRRPDRDQVRLLLFRLAMDLETAPTRADVVDVIARLDRYVDEAMAIARR